MISVSGISKSFGEVAAVRDISFEVKGGQITGLLGPNGAGKTTTLRMLTCYLRPDGGRITVDGLDTAEDSILVRKKIGYLPETVPLYQEMVVFDYVNYVAGVHGVTDPVRVREVAALCGITEVMHKRIGELSKGYRQRVGLAHAMIPDPDILVLDEPTAAMDARAEAQIFEQFRELASERMVILISHRFSTVRMADQILVIQGGRILERGDHEALMALDGHYAHLFALQARGYR